jgi:hypothetical protein
MQHRSRALFMLQGARESLVPVRWLAATYEDFWLQTDGLPDKSFSTYAKAIATLSLVQYHIIGYRLPVMIVRLTITSL